MARRWQEGSADLLGCRRVPESLGLWQLSQSIAHRQCRTRAAPYARSPVVLNTDQSSTGSSTRSFHSSFRPNDRDAYVFSFHLSLSPSRMIFQAINSSPRITSMPKTRSTVPSTLPTFNHFPAQHPFAPRQTCTAPTR